MWYDVLNNTLQLIDELTNDTQEIKLGKCILLFRRLCKLFDLLCIYFPNAFSIDRNFKTNMYFWKEQAKLNLWVALCITSRPKLSLKDRINYLIFVMYKHFS